MCLFSLNLKPAQNKGGASTASFTTYIVYNTPRILIGHISYLVKIQIIYVLLFDFCSIDRWRFQILVFVVFGYRVLHLLVLVLFFSIVLFCIGGSGAAHVI